MDTPINAPLRKLPIGIQSFEKLRSENFLYVDKTASPSPTAWTAVKCCTRRAKPG